MNESKNPSAVFSKSQIQSALFDLMDRIPYEKITVKEILYESKVARKTFYRNFDSKDDVLDSITFVIFSPSAFNVSVMLRADVMLETLSIM